VNGDLSLEDRAPRLLAQGSSQQLRGFRGGHDERRASGPDQRQGSVRLEQRGLGREQQIARRLRDGFAVPGQDRGSRLAARARPELQRAQLRER